MKSTAAVVAPALLLSALVMAQSASAADGPRFNVIPFEFDPQGSRLVASEWKGGLGCPTGATIRPFVESPSAPGTFVLGPPTPYTDPACPTGDQRDKRNQGLLLAKTGPTNNNASAGATITGVKGISLSELGYDLRKPVAFADPRGSHCGAGAPRFNVVTKDGVTHFVGCASPPPAETQVGNGWIRLRWLPAEAFPPILPGDEVKSLSILFDEGQDTGPDNFGLAVLDNIDVNGVLIGQGPNRPGDNDRDEGRGEDKDRRNFEFHDSASRPESSGLSFEDRAEEVSVQSVNGARAITYTAGCVGFVADALFNGESGYIVSFASCDLSGLPAPLPGVAPQIGNYTIAVTGPAGVVYQKSADLVSGGVSIHR